MENEENEHISRRRFLVGAAATGAAAAAAGLIGCSPSDSSSEGEAASGNDTTTSSDPSWLTAPEPIADSKIVETIETEVLVLGAGNAGVSAACSAAENGAKVIVAEKTDTVNGRGGGVGVCNSRLNKELGFVIDPVPAQYRWNRTCGNRNNEALVKLWFDRSGESMDWLLDKADKYGALYTLYAGYSKSSVAPEEPDFHTFQAGEFQIPEEAGYFIPTALLYADTLELGVEYLFSHPAAQLVMENGAVTGAIVESADGYKKILASKGVILATGDIHGDSEMMDYYTEKILKNVERSDYAPVGANTGDGHKMGIWAGGRMQDGPLPAALHPQAGSMFHGPFMFVNKEGRRFFNEANWVQAKSLQIMKQKDHVAFSVFDKNFGEDNKESLNYGGGMFWDTMGRSVLEEFVPAEIEATVESEVETGINAFKADTLEELAEKIGVETDTFLAEVQKYNEFCEAGDDKEYAKEKEFLFAIEEPPFYATRVAAAILVIVGGLHINTDLQVIDENDEAIPGLYAIGNVAGDSYAVDYPINMPGNSNGRCLTWGWLVGKTVTAS